LKLTTLPALEILTMSSAWTPDITMTLVFGVVGVTVAVLGFKFRGSICHVASQLFQFTRERQGNTTEFTFRFDKLRNSNLVLTNEIVLTERHTGEEDDVESTPLGSSSHAVSTSVFVLHIPSVFELFDLPRHGDPEE